LLEGSVQKSNDKIRINVQLIDAKTDKHLWAETYDRDLKDVFTVQTDIAKEIAQVLDAKLSPAEEKIFNERSTDNLQAYDFYLRGKKNCESFWAFNDVSNVPEAIRMYELAIKLDPKYLDVYAALVSLYVEVGFR